MTKLRLSPHFTALCAVLTFGLCGAPAVGAADASTAERQGKSTSSVRQKSAKPDRMLKKQRGKASFYARKFAGRKMADGTPMNPRGNNAASKTLPLGTVARVTNLETGRSAAVTIRDRGPYVRGRIVDLSPATAEQIGLSREQGVTMVEVAPISVPQPEEGAQKRQGDVAQGRGRRTDG